MKIGTVAAGIGTITVTMAAAGRPAVAAGAAVLIVLVAALCWIVTDTGRTTRLVRIIRAFRGR